MKKNFIEDCVIYNNILYCILRDARVVCSIDIKTRDLDEIINISNESTFATKNIGNIGRKCFLWRNSLVITPSLENYIEIYDLEKKEWSSVYVGGIDDLEIAHIFLSTIYQDYLYLIGCHLPKIIKVDLNTGESEEITDVHQKKYTNDWRKAPLFKRYGSVTSSGFFYAKSNIDGQFLKLNLFSLNYEWTGKLDYDALSEESNADILFEINEQVRYKKRFSNGAVVEQDKCGNLKIKVDGNTKEDALKIETQYLSDIYKNEFSNICKIKRKDFLFEDERVGLEEFRLMI